MRALLRFAPAALLAACAAPVIPANQPQAAAFVVSGPEEGTSAPAFMAPGATKDGPLATPFDLTLQRGHVTVLAFYPKDFTSGCTAEFQTYRDRGATIFGDSVTVVGISVDSVESHVRFAQSIGHPYILVSDPDMRVSRMYGSAGDQGYDRRTVYVIGKDGKVKYRNLHFGALDPKAYDDLQAAVAAAK
jgi:peroxiredoxin Q/BCP